MIVPIWPKLRLTLRCLFLVFLFMWFYREPSWGTDLHALATPAAAGQRPNSNGGRLLNAPSQQRRRSQRVGRAAGGGAGGGGAGGEERESTSSRPSSSRGSSMRFNMLDQFSMEALSSMALSGIPQQQVGEKRQQSHAKLESPPVHSGYMVKKGSFFPSWKRRYEFHMYGKPIHG